MRMKREKEDEEEDKKVVVPPVDHNLLPAADRAELHAETQHVGSHKALPSDAAEGRTTPRIRPARAARLLLVRWERGRSRSSQGWPTLAPGLRRLQRQWWRRAGWWPGAVRSGHCGTGEEKGRLLVVAIATNSLEVVAPMSIAARAGGGSSLWPGGAGGLVSCAVISKVLVTVAIPAGSGYPPETADSRFRR